jgi:hypothetical protein
VLLGDLSPGILAAFGLNATGETEKGEISDFHRFPANLDTLQVYISFLEKKKVNFVNNTAKYHQKLNFV